MKKSSLLLGSFVALGLTVTGVYAFIPAFTDVPIDHWAADAITNLQNTGVIIGYPDNTFHPNAEIRRAEVAVMLDKNNGIWMRKMEAMQKEMAEIKAIVQELPEKQPDLSTTELGFALNDGKTISEITMPNLTLPAGIDKGQIEKTFKIGDLSLALVMQGSMNVALDLPDGFTPTFGGILMADKDATAWSKLLTIKDTDTSGNSSSTGNEPYYLWTTGKELMLSIVDQNGGGSGEGVEKVYSTADGESWTLKGCYSFSGEENPNFATEAEGENYFAYSKELADFKVLAMVTCKDDVTLTVN